MEWWEFLYWLIIAIPQVIVILNIIFGLEIVKKKFRWFGWIISLIVLFIGNSLIDSYALEVNMALLSSWALTLLCIKGKFRMVKAFFAYFMVAVVSVICDIVLGLIGIDMLFFKDLVAMSIVISLTLLYGKIKGRKIDKSTNLGIKILTGTMIFTGLLSMVGPLTVRERLGVNHIIMAVIAAILFIVSSVLILLFSMQNQDYKIREKVAQEKEILLSRYYDDIKKKNNAMRSFKHDYKNHVRSIEYLITEEKYDEALKYIQQLNENEWINDKVVDVGHDFVNAILNDYVYKAKEMDIVLKVSGHISDNGSIDNVDWSTILANAISNAIEAVNKVDGERVIDICFKTIDNKIVIEMSNKVAYEVHIADGKIETSKADKENHGFGIKNMRNSIEKYYGSLSYEFVEQEMLVKTKIIIIS